MEELNITKNNSKNLLNYLDSLNSKDSFSIAVTYKKNENLTQALTKTLSNLDNHEKYYSNKELSKILLQLEAMENRISLEKMQYNNICKEYKRFDLLFGTDEVEKGAKVEFYDKANTHQ
jgi:CII-binding regulator of phage lambda lysogenization HflD